MNYGYIKTRPELIDREIVIQKHTEFLRSCGAEKIIVETDGSELKNLLTILEPGDSIHVYSIDRLTRHLSKLEELFDYFEKNNITLYEGNRRVPLNITEYQLMQAITQMICQYDEKVEAEYEEE